MFWASHDFKGRCQRTTPSVHCRWLLFQSFSGSIHSGNPLSHTFNLSSSPCFRFSSSPSLLAAAESLWRLTAENHKKHFKFKLSPLSDGPSGPKKSPSCTTSSVSQSCPIKICALHDELIGATTLASIMNTKLSKQRLKHCYANGLTESIQTIPHNL